MKKAALLCSSLAGGAVQCNTCQRRCVIPEGRAGWCRTRVNEGGLLFSLIYGEVSSLSINPIEKKPVFHYYPGSRWFSLGSVGCNFRCPGCQNWEIAHWNGDGMGTEYVSPDEAVTMARDSGCLGISWTFNEPAIWFEYTLDSARIARRQGLFTNYVTNGTLTREALELIAPSLDVYRVDVKAFSEKTCEKIGHFRDYRGILDVTKQAKELGMHVEIVTNVIPEHNDDEQELRGIASWIRADLGPETPWHVTRFHPHLELSYLPPTPLSTLEKAHSIGKGEGLWYVYLGNVPGHRWENTYCHSCGKLLIERYVFDIIKNEIKNGQCPACGTLIPGRF
jgi:pyruvate formate lyase activating enzyme